MRSGETNKALRILDEAVAGNPSDARAFELRAEVLLWLGRHRLAAADVARALQLAPGSPSWRIERLQAISSSALNNYKILLQEAEEAVKHNRKDAQARYRMAWAHAGLGQNVEAIEALRAAATLETPYSGAYLRAVQLGKDADLIGIFSPTPKAAYPEPPPPATTLTKKTP